ncbi:hypothetical protein V9T40_009860 [Parthenolecanium corni]|uniref:Uncharacterized protein n=1 Tax=Parthenolecanium corni TaxID=536013 RepID=A0AAN9Y7L1_9HEMI
MKTIDIIILVIGGGAVFKSIAYRMNQPLTRILNFRLQTPRSRSHETIAKTYAKSDREKFATCDRIREKNDETSEEKGRERVKNGRRSGRGGGGGKICNSLERASVRQTQQTTSSSSASTVERRRQRRKITQRNAAQRRHAYDFTILRRELLRKGSMLSSSQALKLSSSPTLEFEPGLPTRRLAKQSRDYREQSEHSIQRPKRAIRSARGMVQSGGAGAALALSEVITANNAVPELQSECEMARAFITPYRLFRSRCHDSRVPTKTKRFERRKRTSVNSEVEIRRFAIWDALEEDEKAKMD